jgi:hypothetical protein
MYPREAAITFVSLVYGANREWSRKLTRAGRLLAILMRPGFPNFLSQRLVELVRSEAQIAACMRPVSRTWRDFVSRHISKLRLDLAKAEPTTEPSRGPPDGDDRAAAALAALYKCGTAFPGLEALDLGS